jgi:predicted flap endonuclease-1-like 5' DNA nuclease
MQQDAGNSNALALVKQRMNHVFIDHENVQPAALNLLDRADVRIWIFVGASQTKLSAELAMAAHAMGPRVRYVRISGNGNNALDFHIAYYLGQLACQEPDAFFHIISRDTGFDPLLTHLRADKRKVYRVAEISGLPFLSKVSSSGGKPAIALVPAPMQPKTISAAAAVSTPANVQATPAKRAMTMAQRTAHMRDNLRSIKTTRPAKSTTLRNHVLAQFQKQINAQQADEIIAALVKAGVLKLQDGKVSYL